ncbi:hypothetical protein MCOR27_009621 [Pyricularia oryzae]|uniref:Diaminohydroxyphosphoribosylamino-pyrimidine deaminase n=2 Tax=Pyricularia TaxID=48558 RepID=A0ABQ8NBR4_PYRGI|nr:hypothetical protein MCOR01_008193 [Pyricularia oryzae]KAI6293230.1 hypothetical protein MCOR33_009327 [Pyricularia grisea]KAH9438785.1 hypothetical protein MCOR02_002386 [Pyricularia oryzae]KAI6254412.1 hypothetical protein MCOR19_009053 [Pyricularia oryzae]KAI6264690.1 hypothetical protein MCOR26_011189 [Pyricularia oryzae]
MHEHTPGNMDSLKALFTSQLGPDMEDPEEETFILFSQDIPSQNLGFIDPSASTIELTVAGRDLTIHQSPAILSSTRSGGTTGAVVWKVTPLFAEWISTPDNILASAGVISRSSSVLELGCGTSAVVGLVLAPSVASFTMTDQSYVARLVGQNMQENNNNSVKSKASKGRRAKSVPQQQQQQQALRFMPLDWETDQVTTSLIGSPHVKSFDLVIACDCIYNESLIEPLAQTCVDACRLRELEAAPSSDGASLPTVCVVAQQLRDPVIFESWIRRFHRSFQVWRVPDANLPEGLRSTSGFVVHVGFLR